MRIHERTHIVSLAEADLFDAYREWWKDHDLTYIERLLAVHHVFGNMLADHLRYELREERHGTVNVKADEHHDHDWHLFDDERYDGILAVCLGCEATEWRYEDDA